MSHISSETAFIPSFLKKRISCIDNPHFSVDLKNLFLKYPKEILLKSYRCSLRIDGDQSIGKLYISTNYLCFVCRPKKLLKVFIRLSDVSQFEAKTSGCFHIIAYEKTYNFFDFNHASALSFLSNYLRLDHCETSNSTHWQSKSTLNTSSTISTDNVSSSMSSQITQSHNSRTSSTQHLDSSADTSSIPSTGTRVSDFEHSGSKIAGFNSTPEQVGLLRDCSSFTMRSPSLELPSGQLKMDEESKHFSALHKNEAISFKSKQSDRPPSQFPVDPHAVENFIFPALHSLSDVAFQASCIPLALLCRFVSGALNTTSIHLPSCVTLPSRSFTILIAYVVLAFLAISMAYIYYKIESFHQSLLRLQTQGGFNPPASSEHCDHGLRDVHSALTQLFDLSKSLLLSMNNIAETYGIDVNVSLLADIF